MKISHLAKSIRTQNLPAALAVVVTIVCLGLSGFVISPPSVLADDRISRRQSMEDSQQRSAENTPCVSNEAAAKTASQLGFYETKPTDPDWGIEAMEYVFTELTASELAEVEKGDNSWISNWKMDECFDLIPSVRMEGILAMDKWLTGRRLWKYNNNDAEYWMPAAEAEEYAKRLDAHYGEQAEQKRQFRERRREKERQQQQEQEQEQQQQATVEPESTASGDEPNTSSESVETETSTEQTDNPETQSESEVTSSTPDGYKYRTPQPLITRRSTPSSSSSSPETTEESSPQTEPAPAPATPQPDQEQLTGIDSGSTDSLNEPLSPEVALDHVDEVATTTSPEVISATQPAGPIQKTTSSGNTRAVLWGIVAAMSTLLALGSLLFRQKEQD